MTDRVSFRRQVIGTKVIDVQLIPFMRSRKVFFRAQGLRPRTRPKEGYLLCFPDG